MSSVPEGVIATRLIGYVLVLGNLGWLVYYYGWVWTMTQFMYEYTSWSFLPVPDPASWIDMRFSLNWGLYAALIFNLFPCYILLWIMLRPDYSFRYFIHAASIALAGLIDILWLIWYILWVWIWQNNSTVWPFSVVNSVNFCCKNFGAVASSYACHNFHDCIDLPPVPTIRLNTNPIFEVFRVTLPLPMQCLLTPYTLTLPGPPAGHDLLLCLSAAAHSGQRGDPHAWAVCCWCHRRSIAHAATAWQRWANGTRTKAASQRQPEHFTRL